MAPLVVVARLPARINTHVLISYPALLMGYRIIADPLTDPVIVNLAETFLDRDAKPNVQGPPGLSIDDYAAKFVPVSPTRPSPTSCCA